jgi:hypothetical protein
MAALPCGGSSWPTGKREIPIADLEPLAIGDAESAADDVCLLR